jgi:hypothetical protein
MARSTEDIDIYLGTEIITSIQKMAMVRDAILKAGFEPVTKHFQFEKRVPLGQVDVVLKVDLLAAPVNGPDKVKLEMNSLPRIRPRGIKKIHAYLTEEAVTLEEALCHIDISDDDSELMIFLPHPYTYLVLKLFAFRDRKDDPRKGPYHAVDVYRIIGMMTEPEWGHAVKLAEQYGGNPKIKDAAAIVASLFSRPDAEGILQIRRYLRDEYDPRNIDMMIDDLKVLFPGEPGQTIAGNSGDQ